MQIESDIEYDMGHKGGETDVSVNKRIVGLLLQAPFFRDRRDHVSIGLMDQKKRQKMS